MLGAIAVLVVVYALLAIPALPRLMRRALDRAPGLRLRRVTDRLLGRPAIALAGAAVMVGFGLVAPRSAWEAVDVRTLALLVGMMLLVAGLEAGGAFSLLANFLARRLVTPRRLLAGTMVVVAVLSALVLNDAVVLLFTPVLIRAARAMSAPVFPFLAGAALAANVGSVATPVGNPQNAAISLAHDIGFLEFARALAPLAIAGLALSILFCFVAFRRDLVARAVTPIAVARAIDAPRMLILALVVVALTVGLFVMGPAFGVPLWAAALAGGGVLLALAWPVGGASPVRIARSVDVGILVFFVGLFVLMEGVRATTLTDTLSVWAGPESAGRFIVATGLLSNLVSNVPTVLLLLPVVTTQTEALLLAASSTFAGNATLLGSAATIIVAETARAFGEEFDVWRFTLAGLPLTLVTLSLTAWALG